MLANSTFFAMDFTMSLFSPSCFGCGSNPTLFFSFPRLNRLFYANAASKSFFFHLVLFLPGFTLRSSVLRVLQALIVPEVSDGLKECP